MTASGRRWTLHRTAFDQYWHEAGERDHPKCREDDGGEWLVVVPEADLLAAQAANLESWKAGYDAGCSETRRNLATIDGEEKAE